MRTMQSTPHTGNRTLTIELLALDLATCGRCTGTDANLEAAIQTVADVLREAEVEVVVRKTIVKTAQQAEQLRFETSPTIRINGRDIAFELRESNCGDCGELCGCDGQIDCRLWMWRGREYTEAPKALIVDAILQSYGQAWGSAVDPVPQPTRRFQLPANLRRFFESKEQSARQANNCCDQTACCDESEKEACCGPDAKRGGAAVCGCRS